jgi:Uma2 family endonuclease
MTAAQAKIFLLSPEDYLEGEEISPIKHEYRQGYVYAMAGTSKAHVLIATNVTKKLANHLEKSPCMVFGSDLKVRLEEANCFYYPDISVSCDVWDLKTTGNFILSPLLIIEILSKSTQAFDRGQKFADYQTLASLQEYVLIHQDKIQVECFKRQQYNQWQHFIYQAGDILELNSIDLKCSVEEIYLKVGF